MRTYWSDREGRGQRLRQAVPQYCLATMAVALAMGGRLTLEALFGSGLPTYVTFYPVLVAVALLTGIGPTLLAYLVTVSVTVYWIIPPVGQFAITSPVDWVGLAIFTVTNLSLVVFAELYRRNRDRVAAFDRELAARESQARLDSLAAATFEGIVESEEGRILVCNEQFARMVGCSLAELRGKKLADLIAPEDLALVMSTIDLRQESASEHAALRQDGSRIFVETRGRSVGSGAGVRHTAIRDITERKRADEHVRLQARMLDSVGQAVIATDPEQKILFWNKTASALFGWTCDEVLGKSLQEILPPQSTTASPPEILATLARGESWSGEVVVLARDKRRIPLFTTNAPLCDETGRIIAIIGVGTDISKRKEDEAIIQRQIDELTTFNKVSVGRELRMVELKQEINHLCAEIGQPPKYSVDFLADNYLLDTRHHGA